MPSPSTDGNGERRRRARLGANLTALRQERDAAEQSLREVREALGEALDAAQGLRRAEQVSETDRVTDIEFADDILRKHGRLSTPKEET